MHILNKNDNATEQYERPPITRDILTFHYFHDFALIFFKSKMSWNLEFLGWNREIETPWNRIIVRLQNTIVSF